MAMAGRVTDTDGGQPLTDALGAALEAIAAGIQPWLPLIAVVAIVWIVLTAPMPGRGPGLLRRRDPWRTFKFQARRSVMSRAGGRCEAPVFLAWGRCERLATDADHIYPWSKGGATIVSNGQALCRQHNRMKSNLTPPWWYVRGLERRRRNYVEGAADERVGAKMTPADRVMRTRSRTVT